MHEPNVQCNAAYIYLADKQILVRLLREVHARWLDNQQSKIDRIS